MNCAGKSGKVNMPVKSPKQFRFMHAVKSGNVPGVKSEVGEKFLKETPREKRKRFARAARK